MKRRAEAGDPDALALCFRPSSPGGTAEEEEEDRGLTGEAIKLQLLSDPSVRHRNSLLRCWGSSKPGGRPLQRLHLRTDAPHLFPRDVPEKHSGQSFPDTCLDAMWQDKLERYFEMCNTNSSDSRCGDSNLLDGWEEDLLSFFLCLPTYALLNGVTVRGADLQPGIERHIAAQRAMFGYHRQDYSHHHHDPSAGADTAHLFRPRRDPRGFGYEMDLQNLEQGRKEALCRKLVELTDLAEYRAHTYHMWLRLCFILHREFRGSSEGLALFLKCSRKSSKWDEEACVKL